MRMRRNCRWLLTPALGAWLLSAPPILLGDAVTTGYAEIANVQLGLTDPGSGTIHWLFDNGAGGPAWQGEAWAEAHDYLGGADADYSTTPDGAGVVSASAATSLVSAEAKVFLPSWRMFVQSEAESPASAWAAGAELGRMNDLFSLTPAFRGGRGTLAMSFSFDYTIHLTGQSVPGAGYYSDANANMRLQYQDAGGNWQMVPGGLLSETRAISGGGTDQDDQTWSGHSSTTLLLELYTWHKLDFQASADEFTTPEPGTLTLLLGGLLALGRRRT